MFILQSLASHTLLNVLNGRNLSDQLHSTQAQHPELSGAERAALLDLCYGTLRHYGWLQATLARLLKTPLADRFVDTLLSVAIYQLVHTRAAQHAIVDHAVRAATQHENGKFKSLVTAVLRQFLRQREALEAELARDTVAFWNHPDWWIAELRSQYPKDWKAILKASNEHPPMSLRVNLRQQTAADYLQQLEQAELAASLVALPVRQGEAPLAIRLTKPVNVDKLPNFFAGSCSVQDIGAQLAADYLDCQDGMRVLDACAAPGGKTCHLLEQYQLDLLALDHDAQRLRRVEQNLQRLQLQAKCQVADAAETKKWWDGKTFDRILADVPCSASGVVRRHPDVKWNRRKTDIRQFAQQQAKLIDALWPTLANGGKMLYATCSIFRSENEQQIEQFLQRHRDANLVWQHAVLPTSHHDGFFYALLQKNG